MKNLTSLTVAIVLGTVIYAQEPAPLPAPVKSAPVCKWSLNWRSSWEKTSSILTNRTFHNQGEAELNILPLDILLRTQILDRRTISLDPENSWSIQPWMNPARETTNFTGGLYHLPTDSRILYGVLDERGLPARIRNPWLRSPSYPENHKPTIADLRTTATSTREDELYLYLSSPVLGLPSNIKLTGFGSAQMEIDNLQAYSLAGGLNLNINKKRNLLLESFYTAKTLPPTRSSTWFSESPALPQRDFQLYSAGFLYKSPNFHIKSDFALSETFAWGTDIYSSMGLSIIKRPIFISFAADGAGERFVNRDGISNIEGFRSAAKIEWKGKYNSLLRIDSILRGPAFGEEFNRSSSEIFYRSPAAKNNSSLIRITRISISADRNAVNPLKISDNYSGSLGLSFNLQEFGITNPVRINFTGSIKGLAASDNPLPYPIPDNTWKWDSIRTTSEFIWSYKVFQFRIKAGSTIYVENDEKRDFSFSNSIKFKKGRLSTRIESPDFPEKWNWSISWRIDLHGKM